MPPRRLRRVFFLVALCLLITLGGCNGFDVDEVEPIPPTTSPTPRAMATATVASPIVTQTLEGITVGAQVVYADAHRIVLALSMDGPAQPYSRSLEFSWSDARKMTGPTLSVEGKVLPWMYEATTGMYAGLVSVAG